MPYKDPTRRRTHHAAYLRERYHNDSEYRDKHKARVKSVRDRHRALLQALVAAAKAEAGRCRLCPESEPCCLSFHHIDPKTKRFRVADGPNRQVSPAVLRAEIDKCVCVCENCHRKIHAGLISLEGL